MALAPLSQTVILTEDGIPVLAKTQVAIPPFVPSLLTLFEGGRHFTTLPPSDVPGLISRLQEIEAILKSKGRLGKVAAASGPLASLLAMRMPPRNLAEVLDEILALSKEASSFLLQLEPLTLSIDEAFKGETVSANIIGATAGGRVTCSPPDGMVFDPVALTIAGIPTTVGKYDITLRETHPQGSNSPRLSVVRFTVTAKPVNAVPYAWGDPRLSWGQTGVTWGQLRPIGGTEPQDFWSNPFWTRSNFWGD